MLAAIFILVTTWLPANTSNAMLSDAAMVVTLESDFCPILIECAIEPLLLPKDGVVLSEVVEIEEEGDASLESHDRLDLMTLFFAPISCSHGDSLCESRMAGFGPSIRSTSLRC